MKTYEIITINGPTYRSIEIKYLTHGVSFTTFSHGGRSRIKHFIPYENIEEIKYELGDSTK